jgi:hypothetical protein
VVHNLHYSSNIRVIKLKRARLERHAARMRESRIMDASALRPRGERECNIKIDLKEIVCEDVK